MTTSFPNSLDSPTNPTTTTPLSTDHAQQHDNANDAIKALETKVGVDGSAVTKTHDYKLSGVSDGDKAVSKTGGETLTNKTLTSPTITNKTSTGTDTGTETLTNKTLTSPTIIDGFVGARAFLTNTLGTTVASADTKVALDAETYDVGNHFTDGKFTASVNGYYAVSGVVTYTSATTACSYESVVYVNGAVILKNYQPYVTTADAIVTASVRDVIYLAIGDTVELYYNHTGATSVDIFGGTTATYLTVTLLGQVT